jgi:ankyrin repeat protein
MTLMDKSMVDGELLGLINEEKGYLLVKAIEGQNIKVIRTLIKGGADVYKPLYTNEVTPIGLAFKWLGLNNEKIMHQFLALIPDLTKVDCYQNSALHYACQYNRRSLVQYLIDQGVSVNGRNQFNGTPLFDAVFDNHFICATILLENGAEVNINDVDGETPLSLAISHENGESAHLLIDYGANVNSVDIGQQTPLFSASASTPSNIDLLLTYEANINAIDLDGNTALFKAIKDEFTDNAIHLIRRGANINHKNNIGLTPLVYAVRNKDVACVEMLLNQGAELDIKYCMHAGVNDWVTIDDISRIESNAEIYKMIGSYRENKTLSKAIILDVESCQMPCF